MHFQNVKPFSKTNQTQKNWVFGTPQVYDSAQNGTKLSCGLGLALPIIDSVRSWIPPSFQPHPGLVASLHGDLDFELIGLSSKIAKSS